MPSRSVTDLDSPWKEALDLFLRQFVAFFFPAIHDAIDWSKGYVSLDKEFQRIVRDARVGRRLADKLYKVWLKDGKEAWLLIHIEIQGQREKDFAKRMFTYWCRIHDRYQHAVVSLAVLCDDDPTWKPDRFGYNMWGCEVGKRFPVAKILNYQGQEQQLEKDRNPFAALVLAQLKAIETKRSPTERQTWKIRLFKGLYDRGLGKQQIQQLLRLVDWMLSLPEELEQVFRQEIDRFEEERKMPYVTSYERLAKQEGRQEGVCEAFLEVIEMGLEGKFGAAGKRLFREVRNIKEAARLRAIARTLQTAEALDDVRRVIKS
ncbi:MAG TPA: Rpn family recombination-promoting nuclease/putative transposase [Gemmataceae bacterium]|nr:Rpn family recombination-promoting nuclease/putative transposase [Gemmataceae bacterium]